MTWKGLSCPPALIPALSLSFSLLPCCQELSSFPLLHSAMMFYLISAQSSRARGCRLKPLNLWAKVITFSFKSLLSVILVIATKANTHSKMNKYNMDWFCAAKDFWKHAISRSEWKGMVWCTLLCVCVESSSVTDWDYNERSLTTQPFCWPCHNIWHITYCQIMRITSRRLNGERVPKRSHSI